VSRAARMRTTEAGSPDPSVEAGRSRRASAGPLRRIFRGVAAAVRARPGVFVGVALAVPALSVLLPLAVLSLVRKPVDFFTVNPWLRRLPGYLMGEVPLARKIEFLPGLVLFWFSADSPYGGTDWGFAVDVADLVRLGVLALLFGAYFALWAHLRDRSLRDARPAPGGRAGGAAGVLTTILGLSTGPCSVVGCGAPVLPVVGLAFAGLASGTLVFLATLARITTAIVLVVLVAGVAYLGWRVEGATPFPPGSSPRPPG
jgi:hypothetical protein